MAAYRSSRNETTGYTPNNLMLGREVRAPMDIVFGTPPEPAPRMYDNYADELEIRMKSAYSDVRRHLGVAATRNKQRYDMRVKPETFKVGEKVLYFSPSKYQGYQEKWLRKFSGPFEIIKVIGPANVVLRKTAKSTPFTTHIDKLRKIDPTDPDDNAEHGHELFNIQSGDVNRTANVDNSSEPDKKRYKNSETVVRRKMVAESETRNGCKAPASLSQFRIHKEAKKKDPDGRQESG